MIVEYLTENDFKQYPFNDNCSLKSVAGEVLSNATFSDIQITAKRVDIVGAWLTSYVSDIELGQFRLVFTLFNAEETDVTTISLVIPYQTVSLHEFSGFASDDAAVKVVFGPDMVADKDFSRELIFIKANATLEASAVVMMVPQVDYIRFFNWDNDTNTPSETPEASFYGDVITPLTDLTLEAGSNINFVLQPTKFLAIDVLPGAGTGLYDDCVDAGLVISTINFVGPGTTGNFLMETDDCYVTTNETHGLFFRNDCAPKCSSIDMAAYAHYNNRIVSGMSDMFTYAENVYNTIKNEIARYITDVVPTLNKPYYKVATQRSASANNGQGYLSVVVAFFNPTNDPIDVNVDYNGASLAAHSQSNGVLNGVVPCLNSSALEFTVYGALGTTVLVTGSFNGQLFNWSDTI